MDVAQDEVPTSGDVRLVTAAQMRTTLPARSTALALVRRTREALARIVRRDDGRIALIVGPCSIHDPHAALDYARRLARLRDMHRDAVEIVMRVYLEKPHTALGWTGLINDPRLDGSRRIGEGLQRGRQLLLDIHEVGMPAAMEFVDLMTVRYFDDLVSWAAIGARTAQSQMHRQAASGLAMPIGFKNGTDGNVDVAIEAAVAARSPQRYLALSVNGRIETVESEGNAAAHVVLRGGEQPNYDSDSVDSACAALARAGVRDAVVVDAGHGNSGHVASAQVDVCRDLAQQIAGGERRIAGVMIESHLAHGRQNVDTPARLAYGQSITDECLGWSETADMIHLLAAAVRARRRAALESDALAARTAHALWRQRTGRGERRC